MLSKLQHWQFYLTNDLSARITMQLQLYNSPPCLHDIMLHFSLLWLVVGLSCCIQSADLSSTTPQTQESQFKLSNYAMLIKCGSRFCQGIAYFLHKIFSESYFSASFSCNMRKVANRQLPTKHRCFTAELIYRCVTFRLLWKSSGSAGSERSVWPEGEIALIRCCLLSFRLQMFIWGN